ncbi:MAG: hypothetical protein M1820_001965 [Bogoriella megaspora]|nr:MAG: hypothetical protein M1820_001965 [Bogoriella megaspora]
MAAAWKFLDGCRHPTKSLEEFGCHICNEIELRKTQITFASRNLQSESCRGIARGSEARRMYFRACKKVANYNERLVDAVAHGLWIRQQLGSSRSEVRNEDDQLSQHTSPKPLEATIYEFPSVHEGKPLGSPWSSSKKRSFTDYDATPAASTVRPFKRTKIEAVEGYGTEDEALRGLEQDVKTSEQDLAKKKLEDELEVEKREMRELEIKLKRKRRRVDAISHALETNSYVGGENEDFALDCPRRDDPRAVASCINNSTVHLLPEKPSKRVCFSLNPAYYCDENAYREGKSFCRRMKKLRNSPYSPGRWTHEGEGWLDTSGKNDANWYDHVAEMVEGEDRGEDGEDEKELGPMIDRMEDALWDQVLKSEDSQKGKSPIEHAKPLEKELGEGRGRKSLMRCWEWVLNL